ncbi:MAG: SLC13 family permease [Candidatus Paceibacteria bacterium]
MDISWGTWLLVIGWQQFVMLGILGVSLLLFIKDRFRYDVVALLVIIIIILFGILPYETVLANFGHPAIIIVGCMFIISQALVQSGLIDSIVNRLPFLHHRPVLALLVLITIVTIVSGFVNNIGALAMVIPIALHIARKNNTPIAFFLLPLAFASHLGGYLTLIGTPRNILISDFRYNATGSQFEMFDFLPVGIAIALAGITFITIYAWRFLPRTSPHLHGDTILRTYLTEIQITQKSKLADIPVKRCLTKMKDLVQLEKVFRNNAPMYFAPDTLLHEGDVLLVSGTEEDLTAFTEKYRLHLTGQRAIERHVTNADDYLTLEVVVPPYAKIAGKHWNEVSLPQRFGTNFIGIFRRHIPTQTQLADIKIIGNDVLLLQGRRESVMSTTEQLGLIPIADSAPTLGRAPTIFACTAIAGGAITLASFQLVPLSVIFLVAVALLVGSGLISLKQAYDSIEWPVLVLLAGMISLGGALEASGAAGSVANFILLLQNFSSPVLLLSVVLVATMLISDFINTTASAVIMAPIAISVATAIGASVDPFLMAVAIGASSAFLTPVGHESNALVMQKGGYRFSDFTKMGWPLELIIALISVPLLLYFWPL